MKQIGLASYEKRVARAARTLLEHQGFDGGWGLTLTSVSSIVNTSEVLRVLRAAEVGGRPVRDGLTYLSRAIMEHCRPRQKGGRGENTRFVCFGLTGLLYFPQFFTQPGLPESAAWCVEWLERHQVDHGWPEVAGIDDTSLHQTALAVTALSTLRAILDGLGPELTLPGGVNTSVLSERVGPLITHGVRGLLYHRRSSGAWGWRTYVETAPSPSKTSLCLMAVATATGQPTAAAAIHAEWDTPIEVGGVTGETQQRRPSQIIAEAAQWLLRNHHRWETFVEDDKDVQGTAWEHMAYALGVQAVMRAGGNPYDRRLAKTWRLMNELWDSEAGLWNEPEASGKRATIRAAFYSVAAYEEVRLRISRLSMAEQAEATDEGAKHLDGVAPHARAVALVAEGLRLVVSTSESSVTCSVSERLFTLASLLYQAPTGMATIEIATALHVAPSSVPKYVQRLNRAVSDAFDGAAIKLVVSWSTPQGRGYALAVHADGPTTDADRLASVAESGVPGLRGSGSFTLDRVVAQGEAGQ